jgi:hypothetical protein
MVMMAKAKRRDEYGAFSALLKRVLQVPHSEIKARLEAEKQQKEEKRPKTSDASRASNDKD